MVAASPRLPSSMRTREKSHDVNVEESAMYHQNRAPLKLTSVALMPRNLTTVCCGTLKYWASRLEVTMSSGAGGTGPLSTTRYRGDLGRSGITRLGPQPEWWNPHQLTSIRPTLRSPGSGEGTVPEGAADLPLEAESRA